MRNITTIMKNINLLRESGYSGPIVIYGERPTYSENVSQVAFRFGRVHKLETMTMKHITSTIPMMRERIEVATTYYEAENIHYYSPVRILCDSDQCEVLTPDNELIYFDIAHFTPEGGAYLVDDFVEYLKSIDELRRFGDNSP